MISSLATGDQPSLTLCHSSPVAEEAIKNNFLKIPQTSNPIYSGLSC